MEGLGGRSRVHSYAAQGEGGEMAWSRLRTAWTEGHGVIWSKEATWEEKKEEERQEVHVEVRGEEQEQEQYEQVQQVMVPVRERE